MQYLLLGLAALLLFLLAARPTPWPTRRCWRGSCASAPASAALAGAGFLVFRGLVGYAMSLATLGSWLLWGHGGLPGLSGSARRNRRARPRA